MPVNLSAPDPSRLRPVPGIELGTARAGIRKPGRRDLLVARFAPESTAAGVFTQNRFCAAPVHGRAGSPRGRGQRPRALVVNTGNANAGTGAAGLDARAARPARRVATLLGCRAPTQVLPFSTGVILEPLPVERIVPGLPRGDRRPAQPTTGPTRPKPS